MLSENGRDYVNVVMPLADQLAIFDDYASRGFDIAMDRLRECRGPLIRMQRERLSTIGLDEYDDSSFHQVISDMFREMDEELSDSIFRGALVAWDEDGRPTRLTTY